MVLKVIFVNIVSCLVVLKAERVFSLVFHKKIFQKSEHGLFHNLPCPISEINFLKKSDQKMKQELPQLSDLMIISVLIFIMINFVAIGKGVNRVSDIIALH